MFRICIELGCFMIKLKLVNFTLTFYLSMLYNKIRALCSHMNKSDFKALIKKEANSSLLFLQTNHRISYCGKVTVENNN